MENAVEPVENVLQLRFHLPTFGARGESGKRPLGEISRHADPRGENVFVHVERRFAVERKTKFRHVEIVKLTIVTFVIEFRFDQRIEKFGEHLNERRRELEKEKDEKRPCRNVRHRPKRRNTVDRARPDCRRRLESRRRW